MICSAYISSHLTLIMHIVFETSEKQFKPTFDHNKLISERVLDWIHCSMFFSIIKKLG